MSRGKIPQITKQQNEQAREAREGVTSTFQVE